jgi:phosphoribosyl 1,2-cyclic phosphodiesterase
MEIHVAGTRGSRPTTGPGVVRYGGDTACIAVAPDGVDKPVILLDAGTGISNVTPLMAGEPFDGSILLGHLHWDHMQGLPFFPPADRPDSRVDLYVPAQDLDAEAALARFMSPPNFPIAPSQLRGSWRFRGLEEGEHRIEGFRVLALEIPHKGGRTFGYRLEHGGASIAYLSDHSPTTPGPGPEGIGEYHEAAVRLAEGVDLLIHDAQYTAEEFAERSDWGHCAVDYPIRLAEKVGAGRVLLFHHDPGHDDDFLDRLGAGLPDGVEFAVQGTRLIV